MESTWQHVAALSTIEARRLQDRCNKQQPELAAFVSARALSLRQDAAGLGLYAFVVIASAFRRTGCKARKLSSAKIFRRWNESGDFVGEMRANGFDRTGRQSIARATSEPAVMQYALDALAEPGDGDVVLTNEEFWFLLRVLKTASDCLRQACKSDTPESPS